MSPPRRDELALLVVIVLLAAYLRAGDAAGLAVEHFDEGVYASNLWFGADQGYAYPMRHLYAPPLTPFLAEWALILTGLAPAAPVWCGVLAGLALIPSLWWIGRSWFNAASGLAVATLAATSDLHMLFSRTILTEPWMLLGLVWAVYFLERAVRMRRKVDIVLGGVLTGLTWWTKYNGWLPLAIAGAGLVVHHAWQQVVLRQVGQRRDASNWRGELARGVAAWGAAALIAGLTWAPVPLALRDRGGYGAVAANHRRYVVGLAGWRESAGQQLANLRALSGGSTYVLGPAAILLLLLVMNRRRRDAVAGISVTGKSDGASPFVGSSSDGGRDAGSAADCYGFAFVASWFAGLLVATPCYHPYARLTLPWVASVWLGGGWALARSFQLARRYLDRRQAGGNGAGDRCGVARCGLDDKTAIVIAITAFVVGGAVVILDRPSTSRAGADRPFLLGRQDRAGLARAVGELTEAAARDAIANGASKPDRTLDQDSSTAMIYYIYGEPAVFFHLRVAGNVNVAPIADPTVARPPPNDPAIPTYLIAGPHAEDEPTWTRDRDRWIASGRWSLVTLAPFRPSDVLRLDHEDPRSTAPRRRYALALYRVRHVDGE